MKIGTAIGTPPSQEKPFTHWILLVAYNIYNPFSTTLRY